MAVDYDLVIIGGTLAGRQAAIAASQTGARVALVEPPNVVQQQIDADNRRRHLHQLGTWPDHSGFSPLLDWEGLAGRGVDLLVGEPQLLSADLPTFQVAERRLSARAGLLAMDCHPRLYGFKALSHDVLRSPTEFVRRPPSRQIAIVGQQAASVEWAFALAGSAIETTLILPGDRVLPAEDVDIQRLVAAQLQAVGVRLVPEAALPAVNADQILLTDTGRPRLVGLERAAMQSDERIKTNAFLQTTHPRLYAVGAILGGENRAALAQQEILVAVHNALFLRNRVMTYDRICYDIQSLTPIGRVGLTEQQARQFNADVRVYQCSQELAPPPYALNFCKLITTTEQRLLGAHLMGPAAADAAALLAQQLGRPITAWAGPPSTLSELIAQAIAQANQHRWQPGQWRRDWAENWFNWRRSRG